MTLPPQNFVNSPETTGLDPDNTETADPFNPLGVTWHRVSTRLIALRRLTVIAPLGLVTLVCIVGAVELAAIWVVVALLAVLLVWAWWLIGRQVRAIGYAERADDLLICRGILFRKLVVVPYGRMQFVDVNAGPLARIFRVADVQLHTASPGSEATIPGLPPDEAARLRDRLASRGEAQLAGL